MMQREIRAEITDPDAVAERLIDVVGATEIDITDQVDTYYGSLKLYEKLGRSFLVRVREEDSRTLINYKSEIKEDMWDEHETVVTDSGEAKAIFAGMGLDHVLTVEKVRRSYRYDGVRVHIDSVEGLGDFIEFKVDPDRHDRDDVLEILDQLDIPEDNLQETGYVATLMAKENEEYAEWLR